MRLDVLNVADPEEAALLGRDWLSCAPFAVSD